MKQPRNPWSDGPEYITQCAIEPQTNFTYEVNFTDEEGTLWWHAHSDWTRATVHGAIVILPSEGSSFPFPEPDEEDIIVLGMYFRNLFSLINIRTTLLILFSNSLTLSNNLYPTRRQLQDHSTRDGDLSLPIEKAVGERIYEKLRYKDKENNIKC